LIRVSDPTARYQFGNSFYNTYRPNGFDAAIKWEETTTYNAGIDFGFLNDRLTGSFDVYRRTTDDLLNYIPVPAGSNLTNYLTTNVGSMKNEGFEVVLGYKIIEKDNLNWTVNTNLTHNTNEITKLIRVNDPDYQGVLTGGISGGVGNTVQNHQVGYPAYSFFVFQQVYDESGRPIEGLYVDQVGSGGSVVSNDANRIRYQSPNPKYLAGINSVLNYKQFDFSFSGRLSIDNYVYNNIQSDRARLTNLFNSNLFLNNVPTSIEETGFSTPQYLSSYYVENASFFKMDYISAGYSFNNLEKLKARVGVTVNNAFFITDYKGLDPEVNGGIDNNIYPRPRVFMLSLNLTY
jgi:TonB-dependent starch-binding outer membrane protein SusC